MNIYFTRHLFCFLIAFPSCAVVSSEFLCLTLFACMCVFLRCLFFPTISSQYVRFYRTVCGLFSLFLLLPFHSLALVFILRIEFEFYLLRKINGLYRCHNSHKILSIHFSTVALFPLPILSLSFVVLPLASSQCTATDDVIIRKCVKRKYLLFGTEAKISCELTRAQNLAHQTTQRL